MSSINNVSLRANVTVIAVAWSRNELKQPQTRIQTGKKSSDITGRRGVGKRNCRVGLQYFLFDNSDATRLIDHAIAASSRLHDRSSYKVSGFTTFSGTSPLSRAMTCLAVRLRRFSKDSSETNAA